MILKIFLQNIRKILQFLVCTQFLHINKKEKCPKGNVRRNVSNSQKREGKKYEKEFNITNF